MSRLSTSILKSYDRFDAMLFDLDGTLVDTLDLHYQAYASVLARREILLEREVFMSQIGAPAQLAIPKFLDKSGITMRANEIQEVHREKKSAFDQILGEAQLRILPASRLLKLACAQKPCALVTSGNSQGVEAILNKLGWRERFACVVTGDDVVKGKPDPEPYLLAADRLRVSAGQCVVFEDSVDGLKSGRAAGMTVVDVANL